MDRCDKSFWRITREIGGIEAQRSGAAPSVDELVDHFATKMSNGKEEKLIVSFSLKISVMCP